MDWSRLLTWWRPDPAVRELSAFAARRGLPVRGTSPYQIVGAEGGRWFTVTFQPGSPSLLLVAVDAVTSVEGEPRTGVVAEDGALATRWTAPTADHLRKLDLVIEEMCRLAEELEREQPEGHPHD